LPSTLRYQYPSSLVAVLSTLHGQFRNLIGNDIGSIIDRQKVDGVVQYWAELEPTWMPESELGGARELVDEFKA
jgi:hypothetical protein